jgi:prepilin-type N-terminal cleavage/methylation domain-containing protein
MKGSGGNARVTAPMGFTFIELLVVIVILGLAAAVAVPMMSSAASMQIRAAGGMVAADLEYAKNMAISRGQRYAVVFDSANETYEIQDPNGAVIAHPIKKGSHQYIVDFANDGRLDRVDIVSVDFDSGNTVRFDYLGSPYNQANTDLNSGTVTLQAGGITTTVTVEPVTGFISVSN